MSQMRKVSAGTLPANDEARGPCQGSTGSFPKEKFLCLRELYHKLRLMSSQYQM